MRELPAASSSWKQLAEEFRTDDVQRNSYRISLARALWEVCRRCDDSVLEGELKSAIAAKAPASYSTSGDICVICPLKI